MSCFGHRICLIASFLLLASPVLAAGVDTNTSRGVTALGAELAVRGYDVVAYFTGKKAIKGSSAHAVVHQGATYYFKSAENKKLFEQSPEKYLPQFGGFCAFGVAEGAKFDGDPEAWSVQDGKLYLNLDPEVQKLWLKDTKGLIDIANHNWTKISGKKPEELKPAKPAKLP